jgi:hypothetical protein
LVAAGLKFSTMTVRRVMAVTAIVLAATAAVAGCATGGSPGAAATTTPGIAALGGAGTPTTGASPEPSAVILPDGRSPVLLTTIDVAGRTITFDLIELYLGTAAAVEWKKDHPGVTELPPLNGHYMRNNNPKLRTLPVAPDVVVKVIEGGDPVHPATMAFSDLPAYAAVHKTFWITVSGATVTLMEEQFFP